MSRINTNVSSMLAQRVLGIQNQGLVGNLERLSTGLKINRGKDGPAALIASENLRSEQRSLTAAIGNAQRADQVLNVAEGGLQEVNNLLLELQSLVGETANEAGTSTEEKEANQLQIDSILQTIDRVANSTSFQGIKLLNGNFDYTTSGVSSSISDVTVNSAKLSNTAGAYTTITVDVLTSAQTAEVYLSTGSSFLNDDGGSITLEVTGQDGVQQFTFASGTSQASIIAAINTFSEALGVSAIQNTADTARIELRSTKFGGSPFVRVKEVEGATAGSVVFASATETTAVSDLKDFGRNATVLINGVQAITNGLAARVSTDGFDVSVSLDATTSLNTDGASSTFYITGGGADFNLSPKVNLAGKVSLGIETATTGNLGDAIEGFLSTLKSGGTANVVNGDLTKAQKIIDNSIKQVSSMRGRLGAFQKNTVGATINSLSIALENTAAAESVIRDTDFAAETAALTRQQILAQAATQSLSIANAQPQAVLSLLG
ncbi:MAG: flagellin [Phycisphaerales bacterium]|nr:flagellin [Phycisphaerales bacterium]